MVGKVYEIHISGNCTEINGTIIRLPSAAAAGVADVAGNNTRGEDSYDHQGAMQFIIATILVYSICGVLCTLINRMKRLRGKPHQAYMQVWNHTITESRCKIELDHGNDKIINVPLFYL